MEGTGTFEPPSLSQQVKANRPGQPTRVLLLVEATAAAGFSSKTARKWLDLLLKKVDDDAKANGTATSTASQGDTPQAAAEDLPKIQYALIVYGSWDSSTQAPIQFSSWCSNLLELFEWLDGIQYVGGTPNRGLAVTEALAQAIIMSKYPYPDGTRPPSAGALLAAGPCKRCQSPMAMPSIQHTT